MGSSYNVKVKDLCVHSSIQVSALQIVLPLAVQKHSKHAG